MTAPSVFGSCPQCGSPAIRAVSVKRAGVDEAFAKEFFQTIGAGAAGDRDTVTQGVCTRCGCRWVPRTSEERRLRALSGQLGQEAMRAAHADIAAAGAQATAREKGVLSRVSPLAWLLAAGVAIEVVLSLMA